MNLRALTFWGIFKLTLFFEFAIQVLLAPFFFMIYLVAPDKFDIQPWGKVEYFGIGIDFSSKNFSLKMVPIAVFLILIGFLIQCAVLYLIAKKTPLGKIKIGHLTDSQQSHF